MASSAPASTKIRFGAFEMDANSGELRKSGILLKLQPQPFRVLLLLIERAGHVVTREEIQRCLWTDSTFVDFEHGINFSINQVRNALSDRAENPRYVETIPKRGYRFIGLVEQSPSPKLSTTPEVDSNDGYQSTTRILVEPQSGIEGLETHSRPARRWRYPRWALAISAGASVIVLAGVVAGNHFRKARAWEPNLQRSHIVRLTESGNAEDAAISPDGRYVVYVLRDGEKTSLNVRQVATESDVQILPPDAVSLGRLAFSPDGNYVFFTRPRKDNFKISSLFRMPVLGGVPRELIRHVDTPISFSPDGKEIAFVRVDPDGIRDDLVIANSNGGEERVLTAPGPGPEVGPAWSPDGKIIAFTTYDFKGGRFIWAVSPSNGSKRLIYSSHALIGKAVWLPDGSGLLVVMGETAEEHHAQIWHISYPGGQAKRITNDLTDYSIFILDLTHDGKLLVTMEDTDSSDLWVVPAGDNARERQITSHRSAVDFISAGPDGLLATTSKGGLYLIHDDGHEQAFDRTNVHFILNPSVCRDGKNIVFASEIEGRWNIWRMEASGANVTQITQSGSAIFPVCSPNSEWVLYSDQQGRLQIPISGGTPTSIQMKNAFGPWTAFSPDGKFVAYNSNGWEVPPLERITVSPSIGGPPVYSFPWPTDACALRWAPDGSGIDYILTRSRVGNIWRKPVPKGLPRQITTFTSGLLFSFDWSPSGKQLYVARGSRASDIILISNFR